MTEDQIMPAVREAWRNRCAALRLKPGTAARRRQLEAYLQGVLAVATAAGIMPMHRAQQIALLVAVERGEEFLAEQQQGDTA